MTAYDFNDMPGNETILSYGEVTSAYADTVKMTIWLISPYGEAALPYADVILPYADIQLPPFCMIFPCAETMSRYTENVSAYGENVSPYAETFSLYADAITMDGGYVKSDDEAMSAHADVKLPSGARRTVK